MHKLLVKGLTLICFVLLVTVSQAQDEGTWVGEVVDLDCYVANGASGAGHAQCAQSCMKSGKPMGLLTESGDVVLLVPGENADALIALAGEKVEVKGAKTERGGITMVVVSDAKKAEG